MVQIGYANQKTDGLYNLHLELVSSITSEAFLMCLRRFVARRGLPRVIYSDNARTFKKTSKDLEKLFQVFSQEDVSAYLGEKRITWKFILPSAPWWGGWWERLVRTIKLPLRKVLGKARLNFEELTTVLTEVEAVVNSRPLTYIESDSGEPRALTPADLIIGRRLTTLPQGSNDMPMDLTRKEADGFF
ncbi:uncharacterized protein LOC119391431 [Rhipicephalus sanguineus]|uniref:uncharacterized protein LOC119391431 n=1 Tax=Rhipicephalus sanguineus TaxID=34632 RepID=UPI00189335BA|nr:uncharacterized protein LOC119391431 [Rhipicephalus sanguineus]